MDFDGLIGALNADKADIVLAGMTPDEKRRKSVDFSELYYVDKNVAAINVEQYKDISIGNSNVGEGVEETSAAAFKKSENNKEFIELVNRVIKDLQDSGEMDKFMQEALKLAQ